MTKKMTDFKMEQLAKLDVIEAEAWRAWQRSQEKPVGGQQGEQCEGNAKYLAIAFKCVDRRCKLLRLDHHIGSHYSAHIESLYQSDDEQKLAAINDELAAIDADEDLLG